MTNKCTKQKSILGLFLGLYFVFFGDRKHLYGECVAIHNFDYCWVYLGVLNGLSIVGASF
jgi:hypothetical protein